MSQEISQANKEQARGVTEINKAMSQLDSVTQQNASTSEETARAASELSNQAITLKNSVFELIKVLNGKTDNTDLYHNEDNNRYSNLNSEESKKSNVVSLKFSMPKTKQSSTGIKIASGQESK